MNLPGFTAEASLYKLSRHYHSLGIAAQPGSAFTLPQVGESLSDAQRWFVVFTSRFGTITFRTSSTGIRYAWRDKMSKVLGFTAEASLSKMRRHYAMTSTTGPQTGARNVVPQFLTQLTRSRRTRHRHFLCRKFGDALIAGLSLPKRRLSTRFLRQVVLLTNLDQANRHLAYAKCKRPSAFGSRFWRITYW